MNSNLKTMELPTNYTNPTDLDPISKPVQKLLLLKKTETDIVQKLTKSITLHYRTFSTKFQTFNHILNHLRTKADQQYDLLFRIFSNSGPTGSKHEAINFFNPKTIKKKQKDIFSSQLIDNKIQTEEKNKDNKIQTTETKVSRCKSKKMGKKLQTDKRSMEKISESCQFGVDLQYSSSESCAQESFSGKPEKRGVGIQYRTKLNHNSCIGKDRTSRKRRIIEEKIYKKLPIRKQYSLIGQFLLFPYSSLQLLLDYNESPNYSCMS